MSSKRKFNHMHVKRVALALTMGGVTVVLFGCAPNSTPTPGDGSDDVMSSKQSVTEQTPSSRNPSSASTGDTQDAELADQKFWDEYTSGDARGVCASILYYTGSTVIAPTTAMRQACEASFTGSDPTGTRVAVASVQTENCLAMIAVKGRVCGPRSPAPRPCGTIADLTRFMPVARNGNSFADSLAAELNSWKAGTGGWIPDIMAQAGAVWHPILSAVVTTPAQPSTPAPISIPFTPRDWNETCASGGCGAVPGLPSFTNGGGLSFGSDD